MPGDRAESRRGRAVLAALMLAVAPGVARAQVGTRPPLAKRVEARPKVPVKAEAVLKAIDETGRAPEGYVGGRAYENRARRGEQPLPRVDREGDAIEYRTWDVDPEARGRGAERLVTGSDGSAYYSPDDYRTFHPIRNPARSTLAGAVHADPPPPEPGREMRKGDRPRPPVSNRNAPARPAEKPVVALDPRTAERVTPVLEYVLAHDGPPPETVGGRDYRNLGLDDGEVLPRTDDRGRAIRYREWDVNRRVPGRNRGPERLVTGSDGRAYYTRDHYLTFQRIR